MQWILQEFEDTAKLAEALKRLGLPYSFHKVVPFIGDLDPAPEIADPEDVVLFGAYTLRHYAKAHNLRPGLFEIAPFLNETAWQPFLLNGDARVAELRALPERLVGESAPLFVRPVQHSKEIAGKVIDAAEIVALAEQVCRLPEQEIPRGALRPDTEMLLAPPRRILAEWRIWVVQEKVVTYSLYKQGARVVYLEEINDDALAFAGDLVSCNPCYAPAYVMDICRSADRLKLLETNCINAAGFYAADLVKLAAAIDGLGALRPS